MKLYLTLGIPGSGKSYWAEAFAADPVNNAINLCRDNMRLMFKGGDLTFDNAVEKLTLLSRDTLTVAALKAGKNVIWSDTNFNPDNMTRAFQIAKEVGGIEVIVKEFLDVPLSLCLQRNEARDRKVPKRVIMDMYTKHVLPTLLKNRTNPSDWLQKAIIVDIDGTIAQMVDRSPYDYSKCYSDEPIEHTIGLVKKHTKDHSLIFLSGREEWARAETIRWLKDKCDFKEGEYTLYLRPTGNRESAQQFKEKTYLNLIKDKFAVNAVFEDNQENALMFRRYGLNVYQCHVAY
jgi:predicted kinase